MAASIAKAAPWLLLVLLLGAEVGDGLRILGMFPTNGKSHFVMTERLMRGMAERGHQVDVYSHFPLKKPPPNYTDYSLAGTVPVIMNNMSYEFFSEFSESVSIQKLHEILGKPLCELLNLPVVQKLLKNPPKNPPYDVVVIEPFFASCFLGWGRYLNIPMVGVVATSTFDWMNDALKAPNNLAVEPSVFSTFMVPMTFTERLTNYLLSHYITWAYNYYSHDQDAIVKKSFGADFPTAIELQKDLSLMLVNHHHALNGIRATIPAFVFVGGLHVVDPVESLAPEVQKFLDESKHGFIYFSFGSMVRIETFPKEILDVFYAVFKKIAPIRVLMKIAKPEVLPPGLPSNVITHSWLPQVKVLKHKNIKAFITHGGLMGTQEAIYHGVPMIGIPLFGDQYFNVESYVKKNMAIALNRRELTEPVFTAAINEILNNPIYKQSAEKIGKAFRDVPMDPMDTAAFWIEYVVRHGKNSLRSPAVDMPWWQVNLLDIYAVIIGTVLIVLYIVKKILKMLICMIFPKPSNKKVKKH